LEECDNVQGGLLPRHRVEVVGTITLPLRQKPFQVRRFWRRYCSIKSLK
jgi:hypothetical protein